MNCRAERVNPVHQVTGIAAGLLFDHPDDPAARELQARVHGYDLARALADVCELTPGEPLFEMAVARYREMAGSRARKGC